MLCFVAVPQGLCRLAHEKKIGVGGGKIPYSGANAPCFSVKIVCNYGFWPILKRQHVNKQYTGKCVYHTFYNFYKIYNDILFFFFSECINPLFKKETPKDDHIDSRQPESK